MSTPKRFEMNSSKYLLPNERMELERALALCRLRTPRDSLLIELALKTGARASELLQSTGSDGKATGIRIRDLNSSFSTVHIRGLKGSSDRDVGLNPALFARAQQYCKGLPDATPDSYLFTLSYQRLDQLWHDYRPCAKKFHSLRHTFAVELYRKTRDVLLLKRALGHRNIQNTMVYTDMPLDEADFLRMAL